MTNEQAFSLGSDARLRGEAAWSNPFRTTALRRLWLAGWNDVNEHYGKWARTRRRIKPLVPVKGTEGAA